MKVIKNDTSADFYETNDEINDFFFRNIKSNVKYIENNNYMSELDKGRKILFFVYDYGDCNNLLYKLHEIPNHENITILAVGEFCYHLCTSIFENKFDIHYTDYDDRLAYIRKECGQIKETARDKEFCCAAPAYALGYIGVIYKILADKFNIENFISSKEKNIIECLSEFKVSYEPRPQCNKSILYSIAAGTPIIIDTSSIIQSPKRYLTDYNIKIIDTLNKNDLSESIEFLKSVDHDKIRTDFMIEVERARTSFLDTIRELNIKNYLTSSELERLII